MYILLYFSLFINAQIMEKQGNGIIWQKNEGIFNETFNYENQSYDNIMLSK